MLAYAIRESLELLRDPVRLSFALFGTAMLMLVFGFGVSTDIDSLTFAVLDRDRTAESRAYLEELRGPASFIEKAPLESMPLWLSTVMQASPSTHFVSFAQSILYRGAGISIAWPQFVAVALVGGLSFDLALWRFRSVAAQTI